MLGDMVMPYFMNNDKWYYYVGDTVKLTTKGEKIPKAVNSYKEYQKELKYLKSIDAV